MIDNRTGKEHPLTGFLGMLLLIALIPSIFVVPVERVIFQPLTYQQAVASQQPDRQMVEIFADLVTREPDEFDPQMVRSMETLSRGELEALLVEILPAGWAQNQANGVIEGAMGYLNGDRATLSMPVDLMPLKNSLDAHSQEMAVGIVASWPPCTAEVLLGIGVDALNGELTEIPYCHPGEVFRPLVEQVMNGTIRFTANRLPQSLDLADAVPVTNRPAWWPVYRVIRTLVLVAPLFALALILLIAILSGGRSSATMRAIGQAFFLAAIAAVAIAGIGALAFNPVLGIIFDSPLLLLPDAVTGFVQRVLQVAGFRAGLSVMVWSGLAAAIGLVLWVGANVARTRRVET